MPLNLNDQQTYSDVEVSAASADFEQDYSQINPVFLNDWLQLFVDSVQLLYPQFQRPSLALPLQFLVEWINSDGPYGSNENYYQLELHSILLLAGTQSEICLSFEKGRQGGGEPIGLETTRLSPRLSSYIHRPSLKASFHLWHDSARRPEFQALFSRR